LSTRRENGVNEAKAEVVGLGGEAKFLAQVRVDHETFSVFVNDAAIVTTRLEFDLLAYLVTNAGRVISAKELFEMVIGTAYVPESALLRVHVAHLRRKLGAAALALRTVRGRGLVWDSHALASASLDGASSSESASRLVAAEVKLTKA
jgi:DNA-binding response OmpR family regulator